MSGMMASVTLRAPLTGWLAPIESVPDPVFAERIRPWHRFERD